MICSNSTELNKHWTCHNWFFQSIILSLWIKHKSNYRPRINREGQDNPNSNRPRHLWRRSYSWNSCIFIKTYTINCIFDNNISPLSLWEEKWERKKKQQWTNLKFDMIDITLYIVKRKSSLGILPYESTTGLS